MKTSKIILTSYLGVFGLFLLSFLIQVPTKYNKQNEIYFLPELISLTDFSTYVVTDGELRIISGKTDTISSVCWNDRKPKNPVCRISGDTLFFKLSEVLYTQINITEKSNKNLRKILLNNSRIEIRDSTLCSLNIEADKSEVLFQNIKNGKSLNLNLNDSSQVWLNASKFDSVKLLLNRSKCSFGEESLIKWLQAEIRDSSELNIYRILDSHIKADSTSVISSR